jgi:hypothetical protein
LQLHPPHPLKLLILPSKEIQMSSKANMSGTSQKKGSILTSLPQKAPFPLSMRPQMPTISVRITGNSPFSQPSLRAASPISPSARPIFGPTPCSSSRLSLIFMISLNYTSLYIRLKYTECGCIKMEIRYWCRHMMGCCIE